MIIVSLTTIPPRFNYLHITIDSILSQTILPDKIIINIPKIYNNYSSNYTLPCFSDDKVIINNDVKDYGPATKLLGLYDYELYNNMSDNDIIIVIDDDRIYNKDLIKQMLLFNKDHPNKVLTVAGWDIESITNNKKQPRGMAFKKEGFIDLLGGCCGFLIEKKNCPFNNKEIFSLEKDDNKYYVDDIWISGFITLNNIDIFLIPNATNMDEYRHYNDNISALCDETRDYKNIECIEYFINKYDIWKDI